MTKYWLQVWLDGCVTSWRSHLWIVQGNAVSGTQIPRYPDTQIPRYPDTRLKLSITRFHFSVQLPVNDFKKIFTEHLSHTNGSLKFVYKMCVGNGDATSHYTEAGNYYRKSTFIITNETRETCVHMGVSCPSGLAYRTQVLVLAAECGFESRPWHLCPWARHLIIIASLHPGVKWVPVRAELVD